METRKERKTGKKNLYLDEIKGRESERSEK